MSSPRARRIGVALGLLASLASRGAFASDRAVLTVEADPATPDLQVFEDTGDTERLDPTRSAVAEPVPSYRPLCTTLPCQVTVDEGAHRLGIGRGSGRVLALPVVDVRGPTTLRPRYVDHGAVRFAGCALLLGALAAGTALAVAGASRDSGDGSAVTDDVGVGVGIMLVGALLAIR